jgi:hypothetical protein
MESRDAEVGLGYAVRECLSKSQRSNAASCRAANMKNYESEKCESNGRGTYEEAIFMARHASRDITVEHMPSVGFADGSLALLSIIARYSHGQEIRENLIFR